MNTFLLGVLALCAVILTVLVVSALLRFHRTLCVAQQLLDRFQSTMHHACNTADLFLDNVETAGHRMASWIKIKKRKGEGR